MLRHRQMNICIVFFESVLSDCWHSVMKIILTFQFLINFVFLLCYHVSRGYLDVEKIAILLVCLVFTSFSLGVQAEDTKVYDVPLTKSLMLSRRPKGREELSLFGGPRIKSVTKIAC